MLKDKLDFVGVQTLRYAVRVLKTVDDRASTAQTLAVMSEHYIMAGFESWSVVDGKGKPLVPTPDEIRDRLLGNTDAALAVSDVADDLYLEVMLPLLQPASTFSPPTPIDESTSPKTDSSQKPPKPSKRSSITTIPTDATVVTSSSLDGDSSSSPSSLSAA
jgi:hypothetical protein